MPPAFNRRRFALLSPRKWNAPIRAPEFSGIECQQFPFPFWCESCACLAMHLDNNLFSRIVKTMPAVEYCRNSFDSSVSPSTAPKLMERADGIQEQVEARPETALKGLWDSLAGRSLRLFEEEARCIAQPLGCPFNTMTPATQNRGRKDVKRRRAKCGRFACIR